MIAATERGNRKLAEINTELAAAACVSARFATLGNMPVGDMIHATQARIDAAVRTGWTQRGSRRIFHSAPPCRLAGRRTFDPAKASSRA